jgi:hypothetical protein
MGLGSLAPKPTKRAPMSYRTITALAAVAILGIACISTEALARGGARAGGARVAGVHGVHGGVYRGGVYRGSYVRRGVGWGVGAAAVGVGAAVTAPYRACGYYPYPPCY